MGCEKLKKCVALHFFILNICRNKNFIYLCTRKRKQCNNAEVAQLVEHNLAKVRVAGSSPVFRSTLREEVDARMVESVDTKDLKSFGHCGCAGSSPASSTI